MTEVPGLVVELVLELDRDHPARRTAVRRELGAQRGEPLVDEREVGGSSVRCCTGASCTQSGNPPLRTSPWHHGPMRSTTSNPSRSQSDTNADTSSPPPKSRLPALGLVVVPEHVGRDHGDAARAHEAQAFLPLVAGHAAVVHLARDRDRRAALDLDVPVRERDAVVPVGRVAQRGPCEGALVRSVRHAERARGAGSRRASRRRPGSSSRARRAAGRMSRRAAPSTVCAPSSTTGGARVHSRAWPPRPRVTDSDG